AAKLAGSLGVEVTRLRVKSFHPISAMLEVLAEQGAGIFVFGPDRSRIGRLRYRRGGRGVRARAPARGWLAGGLENAAAPQRGAGESRDRMSSDSDRPVAGLLSSG